MAARGPSKLAQSDKRTLSWLIGIAKRCAPVYSSSESRLVPLEAPREGGGEDELGDL